MIWIDDDDDLDLDWMSGFSILVNKNCQCATNFTDVSGVLGTSTI